jgi:thiol:disulfide interchange protein DsbC
MSMATCVRFVREKGVDSPLSSLIDFDPPARRRFRSSGSRHGGRPYCRKFEADLAALDDVTIHVFPYPVIKPESVRQAKAVWCSRDRVKAWNELMQKRIEPGAQPECETPIDRVVELGRKLGATSTPTWFLPNGERYAGAMRMNDLVPLLDATARGARAR